MRGFAVAVLCCSGLVFTGCCSKAKPGDPCTSGKASCLDKSAELVCQDGKFVSSACKGPKGCYTSGDKLMCDISGNNDGDACPRENDGNAQCTADHKTIVVCHSGKYQRQHCRGPGGCNDSGDTVKCDRGAQALGEACRKEQDYECATDGKTMLVCKNDKWAIEQKCKKRCVSGEDKVACAD